jgi:hypothetical protein
MYRSSLHQTRVHLTGVLIPVTSSATVSDCRYRLECKQDDHWLRMKPQIESLAKKMRWDEVRVNGTMNPVDGTVEVEKIYPSADGESYRASLGWQDADLEWYQRAIAKSGLLNLGVEAAAG